MASGSGLEIRYSLGSGAQRRVTYSPQRLALGLVLACITTVTAVLWTPGTTATFWSQVAKISQNLSELKAVVDPPEAAPNKMTTETTQAASTPNQPALDQGHLKLSGVHLSEVSAKVQLPENTPIAAQQQDASEVTSAESPQRNSATEHLVDVVPLRLWKTSPGEVSAGKDPKAFWSIRIGLHNRTAGRLSGAVAITHEGQTSPAISFKMARYVEKELTIPGLQIDSSETEILDPKKMYESLKNTHFVLTGSDAKPLGLVQYPTAKPRTRGGEGPADDARKSL